MKEVPKASGRPTKNIDSVVENKTAKSEVIAEARLTQKQAERFQTLAEHPEAVEQAKEEARENNHFLISRRFP